MKDLQRGRKFWRSERRVPSAAASPWPSSGAPKDFEARFHLRRQLRRRRAHSRSSTGHAASLDLQDGYDLLSPARRKLVDNVLEQRRPYLTVIVFDCRMWSILTNMSPWKDCAALRRGLGQRVSQLALRICRKQRQAGRYYLIESPAASHAGIFDKILAELLSMEDGRFACGDQCRYGLRDHASGRPFLRV